ncbi:MAG: 50S ribosomal protein L32 [Chlamydiales bacterium]|nr:50S ribosomal protein L32 [Chlamydiales bacterium]
MAVPRNRNSNARKNSKRAHHAKKPTNVVKCPNCSSPHRPHRVCISCGFYDGRNIVATTTEQPG